ncbi:hypothetical protein SE18_25920 [Herpetosiphon geysericola]|uniref:HNH endonuclease 5 domain-containing protein n=1 Tax=Herpetosiphon geysericola TaxID=70996 RepID=A0A0P6YDE4_9CHLR|nr:hypothetical protein SE18_25920 [Herpetosiphon geysericola]
MGKKSKIGTCVYCGETRELTREHVVPRCLFAGNKPNNPVIVPVCFNCNNKKSQSDDYLRDYLVLDRTSRQSPTAIVIQNTTFLRSARKNKSQLARDAKNNGKWISTIPQSESLFLAENLYEFPVDEKRLFTTLSMIVRGLYAYLFKTHLAIDSRFDIHRINDIHRSDMWNGFQSLGASGPYSVGLGVFHCLVAANEENIQETCWLLAFYRSIIFEAQTNSSLEIVATA